MNTNHKRQSHEEFVAGNDGSSALDVILAVAPMLSGSIIASLYTNREHASWYGFCVEYTCCVVPLILSFTLLHNVHLELNMAMLFLLLFAWKLKGSSCSLVLNKSISRSVSCLTSSRATVNLATIVAILGVDFKIFPRRFSKTESFGISLMDVGAACFLFMNGMTDARKTTSPFRRVVRDSAILLCLAFVRLFLVSLTNYQHPVTEYGVHANFFFTLAATKLICAWWTPRIRTIPRLLLIAALILAHETSLRCGLEDWVISEAPRIGLLSQNREFVVSLLGNSIIYLSGNAVGHFLFEQYRNSFDGKVWRILPLSLTLSVVHWFVFNAKPSRRLANFAFISWIANYFLFFLSSFELLEKLFLVPPCHLMEAINKRALFFFLIGNVITGVINLTIDTLDCGTVSSFVVINLYSVFVCAVVYYMNSKCR